MELKNSTHVATKQQAPPVQGAKPEPPVQGAEPEPEDLPATPGSSGSGLVKKRKAVDKRDNMMQNLSSEEEETTMKMKKPKKKESLASMMMENQREYNKFITKKVPKLLRVFGISDSSDTE